VHAPGRCVPQLITFLGAGGRVSTDTHALLVECQDLIVRQLKLTADSSGGGGVGSTEREGGDEGGSPELADLCVRLRDLVPKVKDTVLNAKKSSGVAAAEPEDGQ